MSATEPPFVLDRTENPHPRMLAEAWDLRRRQEEAPYAFALWRGFLQCMCAATGESEIAIIRWMDRNAPAGELPARSKRVEDAIEARRTARALGGERALHYWAGYVQSMVNDIGEPAEAINRWLDELSGDTSFDGTATREELRDRK